MVEKSLYSYADVKAWIFASLAFMSVIMWSLSWPNYISDPGIVRTDGVVKTVECRGAKLEKVAYVAAYPEYSFSVTVGACDRYDINSWVGKDFYAYYDPRNPASPIKLWVDQGPSYEDGWNLSLAAIAVIFALITGFIAFVAYCGFRMKRAGGGGP